jgi:hypothetical protein
MNKVQAGGNTRHSFRKEKEFTSSISFFMVAVALSKIAKTMRVGSVKGKEEEASDHKPRTCFKSMLD